MNLKRFNPRIIILGLFNLLLISVPLYFRFVSEELFEFNKMMAVYTFTSLIVFFWIMRMIQEKRLIFQKTKLDIPILLFLISQVISTAFSMHPRTSLLGYYSRFNGGLLSTISYIFLYYSFVSNVRKKDLPKIFISTFISGIIVSLYGIMEHFGHSISCLFADGVNNFSVSCWKQDVQSRVFASFGQPNWLAAYAITIFPLGLMLAIQKQYSLNKKIFYSVASALLLIVLIFTRSRSGMVGFFGSNLVLVTGFTILISKNKKTLISKIDNQIFGTLQFILVAILIWFGTSFTPSLSNLIIPSNTQKTTQVETDRLSAGGTDSGEIRKIVWEGGLKVWRRYPIFGSGVETFAYSYYLDRPREHNDVSEWDFLYNKAHNELINLLATTGIIGLITYLSIFIVFGIVTLKTILSSTKYEIKLISLGILAGIFGLSISNFFGFSTVMVNTLTFLYFGTLSIISTKEDKLKETKSSINSSEQYFFTGIAILFILVTLIKIFNYWEADRLFAKGKEEFASGNLVEGVETQAKAIEKSPNEAIFYDNLSDDYSKLAVELLNNGQATAAASIANEAIIHSNIALELNPNHLNFYKTRIRVLITLAQLDERLLGAAKQVLKQAISLSPTDPKLLYTQAIIELSNENNEAAIELLEKAVNLKPNYEKARLKLALAYENDGEIDKALAQLNYIINNIAPHNQEALNKITDLEATQ